MMMMLPTGVECSAKIAMTALRACRDATGLLPDLDQTRRIFLWLGRDAHFPITRIQPARRRHRGADGMMNGKRLKFFICNPSV
jgi:hypothetical protein